MIDTTIGRIARTAGKTASRTAADMDRHPTGAKAISLKRKN